MVKEPFMKVFSFATPVEKMSNWPSTVSFSFIFVVFKQFYRVNFVDFSTIRTWIVGLEGKHADHLTTTMAHFVNAFSRGTCLNKYSCLLWPIL